MRDGFVLKGVRGRDGGAEPDPRAAGALRNPARATDEENLAMIDTRQLCPHALQRDETLNLRRDRAEIA
jgi:hypothetical protein